MTNTPILNLLELQEGQTGSHAKANTSIRALEAFAVGIAKDLEQAAPTGSEVDGDIYVVSDSPSGEFAGHAGEIAVYQGGWTYYAPADGMRFWFTDEDRAYRYDSASGDWRECEGPEERSVLIQDPVVGGVYPIVKLQNTSSGPGAIDLINVMDVRLDNGTAGTVGYTLRYGSDTTAAGTAVLTPASNLASTGTGTSRSVNSHPTVGSWIFVDIDSRTNDADLYVQIRYWPMG